MKQHIRITALALLALITPITRAQESVDDKGTIAGSAIVSGDFTLIRDASVTPGLPALKKLDMLDFVNIPSFFGTVSKTELEYMDGVTSAVQTQLNAKDFLAPLGAAEVSVTGATTLTSGAFGRMHVCSGTSADYTVGLPAASGNAGKFLSVRMSSALTKLVTLDANSSELIDGTATRVMWAGETATLMCDGTGWTKIAGKSKPFRAEMRRTASQSIANASITKVLFDTVVYENFTGLTSIANSRITIPRPGFYTVSAILVYTSLPAASSNTQVRLDKNGSNFSLLAMAGLSSEYATCARQVFTVLAAGDYLETSAYQAAGSSVNLWVSDPNTLSVVEVPEW